jgi:GST-like protein
MADTDYRLYEAPGWGSAIVEVQLAHYGLPVALINVGDLLRNPEDRAALLAVNRLGQVPVLDLPSGQRMTESAAITLYLADATRSDDLVPGPAAAERAAFLRWLIFIVANIYPTFTYADVPTRFVDDDRDVAGFVENVSAYAEDLWRCMEDEAVGPWFLGQRFSAIDIYIGVMVNWRPGREWFAEHAPKLFRIALEVEQMPRYRAVFERNFPEG